MSEHILWETIKEQKEKITELERKNRLLGERCNQLLKDKGELTDKIEKMKCCSNCNHFNKEEDIEHCWNCERQLINSLDNLKVEEIIKDEWEIKEK